MNANGLRFRTNSKSTWQQDNMCLTAEDAKQVVEHYRRSYSPTQFAWLMAQASRDTPFDDCREVFDEATAAFFAKES